MMSVLLLLLLATTTKFAFADYSRIVAIGGYVLDQASPSGVTDTAETIDLENISFCGPIPDYPLGPMEGATAALIDGKLKVCGGWIEELGYVSDCYDYDFNAKTWDVARSMLADRREAAASLTSHGWLISGGQSESNTTELWDGQEFVPGPNMPEEMSGHCQVTVNATHLFFAISNSNTARNYMLNFDSQEWIRVEDAQVSRSYPACGLVPNRDTANPEVVVVGNGGSEVFNVASMTWREGPDFQPVGSRHASAQLDDTFALVGGTNNTAYLDTVYTFDPDTYDFALNKQRLALARLSATVAAVPDELLNC